MYRQQFFILANILMVADGLLCITTGYSAYFFTLEYSYEGLVMSWDNVIGCILGIMFVNNFLMARFGFYSEKRFKSYPLLVWNLILVTALDMLILSTAAILIGIYPFSRIFVVYFFILLFLSVTLIRIAFYYYLDNRAPTAFNSRQILLVGTRERLIPVIRVFDHQRSWGHQVAGFIDAEDNNNDDLSGARFLGRIDRFENILVEKQIDEVVFSLPSSFPLNLKEYIDKCENVGVGTRIVPGMFESFFHSLRVEMLQGIPTLVSYSWTANASGMLYKRVLDIAAGFVGFLLFLILFPIIAVTIKTGSPGPVLFKQKRIGMHGREFYLYKFRSMVADAESKKKALMKDANVPWPVYKTEEDPRVTGFGAFIRKTSIDEIPQFINVLKGEMSLVGTRPPTPEEVKHYEDWHRKRISIKPGITGLWQISGRKEIKDFTEVVRLDLQYIDGWKFWHDLVILWKTFRVVLARKGAK